MNAENIDLELALRYIGAPSSEADKLMPVVESCLTELINCISPKYIYKVFELTSLENGLAVANTDIILTGSSIIEHLNGCSRCVLLCATLSLTADTLIRHYSAYDMTRSFVTDCIASAAVEAVCDEAESEIRDKLHGSYLTWRFSPGYGDLPLELQKRFVDTLDAQKRIGLTVTDSLMLIPSKSVTAVIGISDKPLPKRSRGCWGCNMYEICTYRKGGLHCGV